MPTERDQMEIELKFWQSQLELNPTGGLAGAMRDRIGFLQRKLKDKLSEFRNS
jgi:hypothetical protein